MGNCQAVDTASLVIQHPNGKSEKLFWPIPATQIMKTNPGHCVALLITTTTTTTTVLGGGAAADNETDKISTVRVTRVKLLRPTDTLTLGHVYRLISTQEVMKGLVAKKQAKMMKMKKSDDTPEKPIKKGGETKESMTGAETKQNQMSKNETQSRQRLTSSSSSSSSAAALKSKAWQPSLKSISESHN